MANATGAGTKEPAPQGAGSLDKSEVKDSADTSPRAPGPDTAGKRVRAIPYKGGTYIEVRQRDFAAHGIDHPTVAWDFRKDKQTVPVVAVGDGKNGSLSEEAAELLTSKFPTQFEYFGE